MTPTRFLSLLCLVSFTLQASAAAVLPSDSEQQLQPQSPFRRSHSEALQQLVALPQIKSLNAVMDESETAAVDSLNEAAAAATTTTTFHIATDSDTSAVWNEADVEYPLNQFNESPIAADWSDEATAAEQDDNYVTINSASSSRKPAPQQSKPSVSKPSSSNDNKNKGKAPATSSQRRPQQAAAPSIQCDWCYKMFNSVHSYPLCNKCGTLKLCQQCLQTHGNEKVPKFHQLLHVMNKTLYDFRNIKKARQAREKYQQQQQAKK